MKQDVDSIVRGLSNIFSSSDDYPIARVLRDFKPEVTVGYVINWIPEQGEDIYEILIDDKSIITIEIERSARAGVVTKLCSIKEFRSKKYLKIEEGGWRLQ